MESNEWDDQLKELLGDYNSPESTSPVESSPDTPNPEIKDIQEQSWKRIEASLDAADNAFDETISQKVKNYHPQYDPHTWPVFLKRLAESRYLRTKLIVLKSIEVCALLLLLLTVVNMGRMGKLPFDTDLFKSNSTPSWNSDQDNINSEADQPTTPTQSSTINNDFTSNDHKQINKTESPNANLYALSLSIENSNSKRNKSSGVKKSINQNQVSNSNTPIDPDYAFHAKYANTPPTAGIPSLSTESLPYESTSTVIPEVGNIYETFTTDPIASVDLIIDYKYLEPVPGPKYVKQLNRTYTEFGVLTQADANALRMPEDRLYSSGKQIVFPSKGIYSSGFGAGFTIAIGHPVWALETGIIYSAKDFEPGRQLIVGGAFDNGSVEFEAMKLQLISVPLQYRYRIDHTGRFKTYAMLGGEFHVIAQSDVDVQIKYHFASLSFGENPNNDPNLVQTIAETRRIREHIRDGAPFSTKSFVSANAGLGVEYMITEHKALFLQSAVQYQIPNVPFSNNNGKHIRSISLQAGIRGPLGK